MFFSLQAKKSVHKSRPHVDDATPVAKTDKDLSFEELLEKHKASQLAPPRAASEESSRQSSPALAEPRPARDHRDLRKAAKKAPASRGVFALSTEAEQGSKERAGEDCLFIHKFRQQADPLSNGFSALQLDETGENPSALFFCYN